jgi:hypothetical protein
MRPAAGWLVALMALLGGAGAWGDERVGPCYRFVFDVGDFSPAEVEAFASEAEPLCQELQTALGIPRSTPIPVHLKGGDGISSTLPHQNKAVDLFYTRPVDGVEAPLLHETTHILLDSPHPVLREGMATVMEERLGSLKAHPTYGVSLDDWISAVKCAGRLTPLAELETLDWRSGPWETNIVAYVHSGAFVRFLMERHGFDAVVKALQWTQKMKRTSLERICEARFGESLSSLEAAWKEEMEGRVWGRDAEGLCNALKEDSVQQYLRSKLR